MKICAALFLSTLLGTACSERGQDTTLPPPPPPPPPAPETAIDQSHARAQALALGVGACDDLSKIKVLPIKDQLGYDAQFDRMVVNFDGYKACLIGKIVDRSPIQDPSMGPKRHPYLVGNLAYDVITSSGRLEYDTCVPSEISADWETFGAQALTQWASRDNNLEVLQACVARHLGGT
jgi:hypothetical protein